VGEWTAIGNGGQLKAKSELLGCNYEVEKDVDERYAVEVLKGM
jgi:hypothetical protein